MQKKGVDISEHNGSVDFQALKNAGVQFAILRLGYGSDYVSQDDSRFSENVRKAETAGMPWGALSLFLCQNRRNGQKRGPACPAAAEWEKAVLRRVV